MRHSGFNYVIIVFAIITVAISECGMSLLGITCFEACSSMKFPMLLRSHFLASDVSGQIVMYSPAATRFLSCRHASTPLKSYLSFEMYRSDYGIKSLTSKRKKLHGISALREDQIIKRGSLTKANSIPTRGAYRE
nr:hypothetical protein CFP56_59606 [Quercus suber]